MAVEIATLGLGVQNVTAIADANAAALESMGVKGETAQRRLTLSSNPVSEAMRRQATEAERLVRAQNFVRGGLFGIVDAQRQVTDSSRRMTLMQVEAIAMNEKLGASATKGQLSLGRLGSQFGNLAGQIAGTNPIVANLLSVMGNFAIGSGVTVGILAGLAAIAVAYDLFTASGRKAREEADKLTDSLVNQAREARAATLAGREDLKMQAELNQQAVNKESGIGWKTMVTRALTGGMIGSGADAAAQAKRRADAQTAVDQATDNWTKAWTDAEEERTRKAEEQLRKRTAVERKAADELARYRAQRDRENAEQFLMNSEAAKHRQEDYTAARRMGLVPENVIKPLDSLLTPALIRTADSAKRIGDAYEAALDPFRSLTSAISNFRDGLKESATSLLQQFSPGNIAKGLSQGIISYASHLIGSLLGTVVGGVRHALFGDSGEERDAARKAADSARGVALGLDALEQSLKGNTLAATMIQLQIGLISTLQSINDALPGTRNEPARNAARARAQAQEAEQERRAVTLHAREQQYATEDLAVRNLRATGRGDEAGLLAFQQARQREMQAAIDANRDATYLSYLATVQNNELIAYQNGLLATAIRNQPTGFYGIESYLGAFATPRGPAGYPTDSGVNPVSPVNPTGGLTPPGGSSRRPMTVVLQVEGREIARAVVDQVDQKAASTGGAGTSRAAAWELM